jgi:hypothetical protein
MKPALPLLLVAAAACTAAVPQFAAPFIVQANGSDLIVELIADPFLVDWNGDGLNDLIVGQFTEGNVRFYPNSGTNQNPVFTTYTNLQADGVDITTTYG